jgi:hypothetical protein
MRLTLRTLLAYLDDALEPAQAKLIGQKVAESKAAQDLIDRIKQVPRRRRLTTPPMTGPGARFDANTIAEYLDNVLPAEQVSELEETCLASDVHLAEVTACHQVLTLFLGEPALVPPTARQRMYGLIRGREAIPHRKAPAPGQTAGADAAAGGGEEEGTFLGLPFSSHDRSSLRWLVGAVVGCLLVGVGIAIWMAVVSGRPTFQARAPVDEIRSPATNAKTKPPQEPQAEPVVARAELKPEPLPAPRPDTAPGNGTPTETSPAAQSKPEPPPEPTPKAKPASPQPIPASSSARTDVGRAILVPPAVLLQRPADRETWQRLKPQARVFSNDYLVSLPGYQSELRMDSGVHLILWGNLPEFSRFPPVLESAVVLHASPDVDLDLTLEHGRIVLSNHKKQGAARIRLRFLDEAWDLTLPDQNTEVAAELVGICLPYSKEPGGDPELHLALLGLKGQTEVKIRYEQYLLPSPSMLTWDNVAGAARSPVPLPRPPDWWTSTVPLKTPMQAPLEGLTNRLGIKNIDVAIAEAKNFPDSSSRVLALRCLGAMGNYSGLLDCLADDKHADVRTVAIEELRHLLGLDAKNDDKLRKALKQKNYSDGQGQTILQLVHGFAPEQWANPTLRSTAVEYLMHEKLAIRQLTHSLLQALEPDGRKIPYDPAGDSDSRERGYEAWKKLVLGAKLKSKPSP